MGTGPYPIWRNWLSGICRDQRLDPDIVRQEDGSYLVSALIPVVQFRELFQLGNLPGEEEQQVQEFIDATNRIRLSWVEILLSRITNVMLQPEEYRSLQQRRQALKQQLEGQKD